MTGCHATAGTVGGSNLGWLTRRCSRRAAQKCAVETETLERRSRLSGSPLANQAKRS